MRIALVVVLAVVVPAVAWASECDRTPVEAGEHFYKRHQSFIHKGDSSPPLTPELAREVGRNIDTNVNRGKVGSIDWNFWTEAQDGEQSSEAKGTLLSSDGKRALVRLMYTFTLDGQKAERKSATVALRRSSNGCWLVADVRVGKRSVLSLLASPSKVPAPR